jgi:hypothetical protein
MELTRNIRLRRLQWVGHMLRMKDERAPKKALKRYVEGRRPVGRQVPAGGELKRQSPMMGCSSTGAGYKICVDLLHITPYHSSSFVFTCNMKLV